MKRLLLFALSTCAVAASLALAHDGDPKILDRKPAYPGRGWRNAEKLAPSNRPFAVQSALGSPSTQFARSNVTLLSWLSLPDFGLGSGATGSSCFGYTSPSGREYALMGHSGGMSIVEVTQPGNATIVATIVGNPSLWRDVRVFSHYAYVVTENNGGVQVVDLANIDAGVATLVNTVITGGTGNTHTLEINTTSGFLYRAGGGANGLRIYDLNQNPVDPPFVGQWPDRYVHEVQVVSYPGREIAICCGGLNTGFSDTGIDIVDVTNKASPVLMQHLVYGSPGYSHQACLSPDRQFLYQDDETDTRPFTRVFDASTIGSATPNLTYLGEFQNGTSVDHNVYTKGNLMYEANYRSGLRVFDRSSNPIAPTLTAWFDTYPEDDNLGYNGLWNNYPYFASGVVIGSDLERGLFVWWVGVPQLALTFPDGVPAVLNPAGDTRRVNIHEDVPGRLVGGTAKLWTSTGGPWTSSNLVHLAGEDYAAIFPAVPCGTTVEFYVAAQSQNGIVWTAPELAPDRFESAAAALSSATVVTEDFETNTGWQSPIAGDTATSGTWTRVNPIGTVAQPEDDHTSGAGATCWVTTNGFTGALPDSADVDGGFTTLRSPRYDMSGGFTPVVRYWRWYSNDQGGAPNTDVFRVDISNDDGANWTTVETVGPAGPETAGGWFEHEFVVNSVIAPTANMRLRFVAQDLGADSIIEAAVDDVTVTLLECNGAMAFCSGDGSAAPCPCGIVAAPGAGCANSVGAGASLAASGTPDVFADTLVFSANGTALGAPMLFFQGTTTVQNGLGAMFGDGLLCAGGTITRLAIKFSTGSGPVQYPVSGDALVSTQGAVPAGATRYYQTWYRDSSALCLNAGSNFTNGVAVLWR